MGLFWNSEDYVNTKRQARGIKRSSVMKVQRQMLLLRCLGSGPKTSDALIDEVNSQMLEAYPKAAREALRHDLRALREVFGCVIEYTASVGYRLVSVGDLALLNLTNDEIAALRFLDATYTANSTLPDHQQVRRLVERIIDFLPIERRGALNVGEPILQQAGPVAPYEHDPQIMRSLRKALAQRREIRFRYTSSQRDGEETHRVGPVNIFTRDGHMYLLGYCFDGPQQMVERVGRYVDYRIDYISKNSLTILPRVLPPALPKRPTWTVKYELRDVVARNKKVAHWFADTDIQYRDDGSALVTATVHNLWQTRQILLRYLENCRVLEPPELIDMMRATAQGLRDLYPPSTNEIG
ncbi:MAG TPA: WYL domain-containing protein [Herpetosiphon sp.]|nr:WYL domain-containing protein [Herpetosiphon sp.]